MVRIRLSRAGRTHLAFYKIVVTPLREKRDSKFIEQLGFYSPHTKEIKLEKERVEYWLSVGAQPSDTVKRLFIKQGLLKAEKSKATFKNAPKKKSVERAKAKAEKVEAKKKASEEPKAEVVEAPAAE